MKDPFHKALAQAIGKEATLGTIARPLSTSRRSFTKRNAPPFPGEPLTLQLVEGEDHLDWEEIPAIVPGLRQAKRGASGLSSEGTTTLQFARLAPSEIGKLLEQTDRKLTPRRGLRRWNHESKKLEDVAPGNKPILLVIHGTFSNGDNFFKSLLGTDHGKQLLEDAVGKYRGEVYSFDHPTLSVSPLLNALDLQQSLGRHTSQIDFVAHSRGGLVARWWLHLFDPSGDRCRQAILVGSPMAGTSLAAPPNIRNAIKQLTSYGKILSETSKVASFAVPCLAVVHALLRVLTSVSSLASNTPLADAAIGLVPGLCGQSRVGNSPELLRLQSSSLAKEDRFHAILSNFESSAIGWRFWKAFRKEYVADSLTDWLFNGPNDLVVDCESMTQITDQHRLPKSRCLDFGTNEDVHHINYFDFEKTSAFLSKVLKL